MKNYISDLIKEMTKIIKFKNNEEKSLKNKNYTLKNEIFEKKIDK